MADGETATTRVYFPGLNILRFYAAISVVIAHTSNNFGELRTRPAHYALLNWVALDAQSAVNFFFVLSGFLITYLLIYERQATGNIAVRKFYLRRILRIWPLYYFICFLCFIILPLVLGPEYSLSSPPVYQVVLVLLILPNFLGDIGPLNHLWSIGVEEQFYLVWPWAAKNRNRLLKIAGGILIVKIISTPVIQFINSDAITHLFLTLRFECVAIGALGAYLYYEKHPLLRIIYSWPAQAIILIGMVYLAIIDIPFTEWATLLVSAISLGLILNIATNRIFHFRFENKAINYLGQISYGVYLYHYPLLYCVIFTLKKLGVVEDTTYDLILYTATLGGTLLLASISYRWLESPFLKFKQRDAVVASSPVPPS